MNEAEMMAEEMPEEPVEERQYEPLDDDDLAALIDQEMRYTLGGSTYSNLDDSELSNAWVEALNYYFGKPRGDEVEGRSHAISMDVADMVEQTLAQIIPSIEVKNLVDFGAYNVQDEPQAQVESGAVNWAIMDQNNGLIEFISGVKDALLQRNGIIKIYVEEKFEIDEHSFEGLDPVAVDQIINDPNVEVLSGDQTSGDVYDQMGNLVIPATYRLDVRVKIPVKQLVVESVAPDEFSVNADHNSIFLHNARFVQHTRLISRSDLIKMGIDPEIVKELKKAPADFSSAKQARNRSSQEDDVTPAQEQAELVEVNECYYQVDYDGDGVTERRKILKSDNKILDNEIFPVVPFASGTPFLIPHKFWGMSMHDKVKNVQDVKTQFLRKTLDNAEGLINQRVIAVSGQVNMDDVLSARPTGVVRAKRVDAVAPFPVQNMGDTGFRMLNYMDKIRKEAGGSQLDVGTQENIPVQSQTAHGMERWMSSQEQMGQLIIKTIALTMIKGTFQIAHWTLRRFFPEQMTYKSGGKMVSTIPGTWPARSTLTINLQLSMAERQRRYMILDAVIEKQMGAIQNGLDGVLASKKNVYNALVDQARIAGFENPERYWIDPDSQQAQQAAQANSQARMQAMMMEQKQNDKILQLQAQVTAMQESSDRLKANLDYIIKYDEQIRKWVEMGQEQHNLETQPKGSLEKK